MRGGGECKWAKERKRGMTEKSVRVKKRNRRVPTVLRALFGAQGQASTGSKRASLCVVSTPPPANLHWGQGPHYSGGN